MIVIIKEINLFERITKQIFDNLEFKYKLVD